MAHEQMRIAIFNYCKGSDYFNIGGNESLLRRLTKELAKQGVLIDWLLYGAEEEKEVAPELGVRIKYFRNLSGAIATLNAGYDHVLTTYLRPADRIKFGRFRKSCSVSAKFHFLYLSYPESAIRKFVCFLEAKMFPYSGRVFCVSTRQLNYVSRLYGNAACLLPPVPAEYFVQPLNKPQNKKITVTFLGRVDPGKGIAEVVDVFLKMADDSRFECAIYGIHFPFNKESVAIHKDLLKQRKIRYVPVDRQRYSPEVDGFVRDILASTDIFLQPYQKLSSTIDTPLLLLEAMASLCAVITKPFGNIPDVYGKSEFLLSPDGFVESAVDLLNRTTRESLQKERVRVYARNTELQFDSAAMAERFLKYIND